MTDSAIKPRRVRLLSTFEIAGGPDLRTTSAWRSQQNRTILKILLIHRRHVVATEQLLEYLWRDEDPAVTRQRLYVRVSQIRSMLDPDHPHAIIQSVGGGYRFDPDPTWWVDVDAFEAAAEQGRRAQEAGALADAVTAYEEARRLYRGDLLEEDRYAEWALAERERLQERYLTLLTELAEAYAQQGRYRRAIALYQEVLARDSFREAVFVRLMLAAYHAGEKAQALRIFERCRRILAEEMGVTPLPTTMALAEQIRAGTLTGGESYPRYPIPAYQGRLFNIPYSLGHTPWVGREREYAWLVARVQAERTGLVLIEGEAGIGKTRLVEEALGFVATQQVTALRLTPLAEGAALPYAPWIDLLRPLVHQNASSRLPATHRKVFDMLFGPRRPGVPERESGAGPTQQQIEDAILQWLEAELPRDVLIFVDDGPRLDPSSLALTLRLAGQRTVLMTARSEEFPSDHPLRVAFHELARTHDADLLRLERLSDAAVTELIRRLAQGNLPAFTAELVARTAGNPLFLVAALQGLFEAGDLYIDGEGHWAHSAVEAMTVPATVRAMVERRLQRLDREQRRVFDALAVVGGDVDFALLQSIVGMDEGPLLNTLDALLDLGLVVEPRVRDRGEFAPTHSVYVEVACATLPPVRRRRLHGQVADALQTLHPDDPDFSARLAYHYHQADRVADAVSYAVLAGEVALDRYALQQACALFEGAERWAETAGWAPELALQTRLHAGWAEALRRSGQPAAAFRHYAQVLNHAEGAMKLHVIYQMAALQATRGEGPETFSQLADDLESELSAPWMRGMFRCSQAFWAALRGDPTRSRRCAAEGWQALRHVRASDEVPSWLLDRATIMLARTHALWGEWRHVLRYAEQALAYNTVRNDVYGAADAHATLAQAYYGLGALVQARWHAEQALTTAEEAGDLRVQGKALYPLALALLDAGRPADVDPLIRRLYTIAEQTEDLEPFARGRLLQAELLSRAGEAHAAEALLAPLLAKARSVGVPAYVVMTLRQLAAAHLATGAFESARAALDEARILAVRCRMRHESARLRPLQMQLRRLEQAPDRPLLEGPSQDGDDAGS